MEEQIIATGRRKTAVATVRLKPGSGKWNVNGRELRDYIRNRQMLIDHIHEAYKVTETEGKFDVFCRTRGGGISGQAGAMRLALARALTKYDSTLRQPLKEAGLLTRDPREVERKKYGMVKARKRFQYSKR
ncbi:MAG: 30S ribosomal protein S9 [candidate division Zixibacteria bacterium]|nr:30S ribosomal protein S9 [candidate division Zixibacteria bacterium]